MNKLIRIFMEEEKKEENLPPCGWCGGKAVRSDVGILFCENCLKYLGGTYIPPVKKERKPRYIKE